MKKSFLFVLLIVLCMMAITACGGTPDPAPEPAPAAPPPPPPPPTPPPPPPPSDPYTRHSSGIILDRATQYTVKRGDTLAGISRRFYEDASWYPLIVIVCDNEISDTDRIVPGMRLTVPVLKENLEDSRARESINRKLLETAVIEEQRGRNKTAELLRNNTR
ncbi:MAG: LysM peptidoglycan-binding domain-containing protein [Treponema sp.]|jgi:hypothetical protein|nr:LysM peptidoglycan-binding domain-containing protein [Treponema sp.]